MTGTSAVAGTAAQWDRRYAGSASPFGDVPSAFLVEQAFRVRDGDAVLSLGEGDGRHAVWLAEQRRAAVTALDVSPVALAAAKERARARGVEISTRQGDLLAFDWPGQAFDVVLWFFAHVAKPDLPRVAEGAWRALRPGGLMIGRLWTEHAVTASSGPVDGGTTAAELLAALPDSIVHLLSDAGVMEGRGTPGGRPHRHTDFVLGKPTSFA